MIPLSALALEPLLQCTNLGLKPRRLPFHSACYSKDGQMRRLPFKFSISPSVTFSLVRSRVFYQREGAPPTSGAVPLTLTILVGNFSPNIPCAGFIDNDKEGVPKMTRRVVSGTLVCVWIRNGPCHRSPKRQIHPVTSRVPLNKARALDGDRCIEGKLLIVGGGGGMVRGGSS